ncbi:pyruvate formate lyase-activating protein, partial [bacterium]|nr:pyruvate formate lyase-activating protein [bacterium]
MMLAVDVGAGTQDILLYREGMEHEGLYKMVMPSQTVMLAKRIRSATDRRKDVFLHGYTMGGGPLTAAVRRHIASGLRVYATEEAALSLHDNLQRVRSMGVEITED